MRGLGKIKCTNDADVVIYVSELVSVHQPKLTSKLTETRVNGSNTGRLHKSEWLGWHKSNRRFLFLESCKDVKFGTMNSRTLQFIGAGAVLEFGKAKHSSISHLHETSLIEANNSLLEKRKDSLMHRTTFAEILYILDSNRKFEVVKFIEESKNHAVLVRTVSDHEDKGNGSWFMPLLRRVPRPGRACAWPILH
ncbi:hypothetical protein VNO77_39105 [Canavalia gladiata]|uniref:Uncharacterized protein n=1 Tax=Canavalia gladiata TaxID=3824 RepID=A0AAN9K9W1_CANGL